VGADTFQEFTDYLQFHFGQTSELLTTDLTNSGSTNMYGKWINKAYHDITERGKFWTLKKRFYFPELETDDTAATEDGVAYVSYPDYCYYPQEVYDETNNVHLKWMPWTQYVDKTDRLDTSKESNPTKWTRRGSEGDQYIYLYPTPDTDDESLRIYYRRKVIDISGTGTTLIGEEWDEPILILAMMKGRMWMNDWDKVAKLKEEWIDMVKDRQDIYVAEELGRRENFRPDPRLQQ